MIDWQETDREVNSPARRSREPEREHVEAQRATETEVTTLGPWSPRPPKQALAMGARR